MVVIIKRSSTGFYKKIEISEDNILIEIISKSECIDEKNNEIKNTPKEFPEQEQDARLSLPEIETVTLQNSFATRLRLALAHSGMKQADLAEWTGLSQSAISSYVTGKVQPHIGVISKLSEALGVHIDWLLNGTGDMVYLTHSNEI